MSERIQVRVGACVRVLGSASRTVELTGKAAVLVDLLLPRFQHARKNGNEMPLMQWRTETSLHQPSNTWVRTRQWFKSAFHVARTEPAVIPA